MEILLFQGERFIRYLYPLDAQIFHYDLKNFRGNPTTPMKG